MNSAYLRAAGKRRKWLTYMLRQGKDFGRDLPRDEGALGHNPTPPAEENYYRTQGAAFLHPLRQGEFFYLADEGCSVVQQTVDKVSYDPVLQALWLPASAGLIYFEDPPELSQLRTPPPNVEKAITFRALGWSCLQVHREEGTNRRRLGVPDDPRETEITMWATMQEMGDAFFPVSFLSWNVGQSLERCIAAANVSGDGDTDAP